MGRPNWSLILIGKMIMDQIPDRTYLVASVIFTVTGWCTVIASFFTSVCLLLASLGCVVLSITFLWLFKRRNKLRNEIKNLNHHIDSFIRTYEPLEPCAAKDLYVKYLGNLIKKRDGLQEKLLNLKITNQ